MTQDISKNTIVILVVLTVAISLLGTWTVVNEVNSLKVGNSVSADNPTASGYIKLTISPPPEEQQNSATGRIALEKTQ